MNRRNFLRKSLGLLAATPLMGLFAKAPHRDASCVSAANYLYRDELGRLSVRKGRIPFYPDVPVVEVHKALAPWIGPAPVGWRRVVSSFEISEDGTCDFTIVDREMFNLEMKNRTKDGSNGRAECTVA